MINKESSKEYCILVLIVGILNLPASLSNPGLGSATRHVNTGSVANLASRLSARFAELKCDVMKAGIKCNTPGLQQRWEELAADIYSTRGSVA